MMRQQYLASERPGAGDTRLLLSGCRLDDAPARNRAERAESAELPDAHPAKQNSVTEDMKAENPMRWAAQMNSLNIRRRK